MTIKVFLVDDQELVRAGFAMVLAAQPDMEVVGEAADGAAALAALATTEADVVVMDIRMPVMDGVEATRRLCERERSRDRASDRVGDRTGTGTPKVLALTTFDTDEDAFAALQAGASGFLLKNVRPVELLAAIRVVASGESVVAPRITRRLLDRFAGHLNPEPAADDRLAALTAREREVLALVAAGLSNTEIANQLYVAEATVKTHLGRILTKLDLRDRVQAVVFAYRIGLVRPGP
ncbi:response regulator transcription factor [Micromonospora sp. NBC_01813]|uniref:response regulator transcription factor n=1 Tax=Micromonospora sp. NBC_01813 TaxID=2975988 RepID=UPI002DDB2839|nr:response regulator transcription factor [Micromonospora sp. NBC_01813]WSA08906.1 response regulator transcription factor [Micromonospora sp. NBC_01813]